MGWLFTMGQTRKELIESRTQDWAGKLGEAECLAHCVRGNVIWTVWEQRPSDPNKPDHRYIGCDLMRNQRGYGWGYKDMSESMQPYYYTCPESYLDMVPPEYPNSWNTEWREKVRAYHQLWRDLQPGVQVKLNDGFDPQVLTITSKKPLRGYDFNGKLWGLERGMVDRILAYGETL